MVDVYGLVPNTVGRGRPAVLVSTPARLAVSANGEETRDEHGQVRRHQTAGDLRHQSRTRENSWDKVRPTLSAATSPAGCSMGGKCAKRSAFSKSSPLTGRRRLWEDGYYNLIRPHKSLRLRFRMALPQNMVATDAGHGCKTDRSYLDC